MDINFSNQVLSWLAKIFEIVLYAKLHKIIGRNCSSFFGMRDFRDEGDMWSIQFWIELPRKEEFSYFIEYLTVDIFPVYLVKFSISTIGPQCFDGSQLRDSRCDLLQGDYPG